MTGSDGILGVPSEHFPGLLVLVLFPVLVASMFGALAALDMGGVGWARAANARLRALGQPAKVALLALGLGAVVHAVLVPTHASESPVTAGLFALDAVGLAGVFVWTILQRPCWRSLSVVALGGTAGAYVLYLLNGFETADLVGLATSTVEMAAAAYLLVSAADRLSIPRRRWSAALAAPLALASLVGMNALAGVAHAAPSQAASSEQSPIGPSAAPSKSGSESGRPVQGMAGSMGNMGGTGNQLSLATDSPAGPIVWPYSMADMAAGMDMVPPNCTSTPTPAQRRAAMGLVNQTVQAVAPYQSLTVAKAAGYVPITPTGKVEVHYINYAFAKQNPGLDPNQVPALVYVNTPNGAVLVAAMYLSVGPAASNPPQPGGCLTEWHVHDNLCFQGSSVVGNENQGGCAVGSSNHITDPMMHVWLVNVPGGPLAPDPGVAPVVAARQLPRPYVPNGTA